MLLVYWLLFLHCWVFTPSNADYPEMVLIPGGSFYQGDSLGNADEKPVRKVRLDSFFIGKTEVTLAQFQEFIQTTGYLTDAERNGGSYVWTSLGWTRKDGVSWRHDEEGELRPESAGKYPVMHVSWRDAANYCNWLSAAHNLQARYIFREDSLFFNSTDQSFRLPTEAEWEFAAKGNTPPFSGSSNLAEVGWYSGNAKKSAHPVGLKKANSFGLFDCSGNVWEWCEDYYSEGTYKMVADSLNPRGPSHGASHVVRGGSWSNNPRHCRVANRSSRFPDARDCNLGFRVVCTRG